MAIPYLYPSTFPYGSRVVTVNHAAGGSSAVIMESFDVTEGTFEIARQDQLGAPNGFALGSEPRTGTSTAQLASTSSTYCSRGDTFNTSIKGGTAVTFVITQAGYPEAARDYKKQQLTFREEI